MSCADSISSTASIRTTSFQVVMCTCTALAAWILDAYKYVLTQLDLASTRAGSTFEWQMLFRAETPLELLDYILYRWDEVSTISLLNLSLRSAGI